MSNLHIRTTTAKDATPFLASKWLHTQLLLDTKEMQELLLHLKDIYIFSTMGLQPIGNNAISKEVFLANYEKYINSLRGSAESPTNIPQDDAARFFFTSIITNTLNAVQAIHTTAEKELIRPVLPVMQMQLHHFDFSQEDHKFRPLVFGKDTISWGVQISYPQLFQDPVTRKTENALDSTLFENAALFRTFQLWVRANTVPTPFVFDGKQVYVPFRIGKKILEWIGCHPQLTKRGLKIGSLQEQ